MNIQKECEILLKNFKSLGKYCQNSLGGYFLPHPIYIANRSSRFTIVPPHHGRFVSRTNHMLYIG